jgi:hypothetical protein
VKLVTAICVTACIAGIPATQGPSGRDSITEAELRADLSALAGDATEGRGLGTEGYLRAAMYAIGRLEKAGCLPGWTDPDGARQWLQPVPLTPQIEGGPTVCYNVLGIVPGSDEGLARELVIVSAHLDHLGVQDGKVFNGANDDASGCATAIEVIEAVALAPLPRTVMILLTTGEEAGHLGSKHFVANPPVPLETISAAVTLEHLGRPSPRGGLEVFTSRSLFSNLREPVRTAGERPLPMALTDRDRSGKVRGSDTNSFIEGGVPVALLGGGAFDEYHTAQDDPDLIDYPHLLNATRIAYGMVVSLATRAPQQPEF